MQAREFIIEVSLENLAKTPIKGGMTLGDAIVDTAPRSLGQDSAVGVLELISAADPTNNNSMTKWLAMQYLNPLSNFNIPEDVNQVKQDLTKYLKLKNQKKLQGREADLNTFKKFGDLYDVLEKFNDEEVQSGKEQKKQTKAEGIDTIIKEPGLQIYHTKTHEANCLVGKGTKWCTASKDDDGYFKQYSEQGPLYAIIEGDGANQKKYQFHYESDQFLNARDEDIVPEDIARLSKHPGWAKFLNMQIKEHYGQYFKDAA